MGEFWVLGVLEFLLVLLILMTTGRKVKINYANIITELKPDNTAIGYF